MGSTLNAIAYQTINLINGAEKYPNYSGPLIISSTGSVNITANNGADADGMYNDQVTFDFITPTLTNNGYVYAGGANGSAEGGIGVDMQVFSAVVNNGSIRGGSSHGEVVVGGSAYGVGGAGVYLKGGSLTGDTSSPNVGEGGVGVELDFSAQGLGQTQLISKGVVQGGELDRVISEGANQGIGVVVNANTILTNSGTVYGGSIGVDINDGTVYNSGQIDAYDNILVTKGPHYDAVNFNSVAGGKLELELPNDGISTAGFLPSESYLDTGNRQAFINGGAFVEAHPDFRPKHWTDTCAPLIMEGEELRRAKSTVLARASALGCEIASDAGIHIVADGKRIDPMHLTATRVAFLVPDMRTHIELCSRYFVPAHVDATSGDTRALVICVGRLQLDGAEIALGDDAILSMGWHRLERGLDGNQCRWSWDRVPLPSGTRLVVIDIEYPGFCWARSASEPIAIVGPTPLSTRQH